MTERSEVWEDATEVADRIVCEAFGYDVKEKQHFINYYAAVDIIIDAILADRERREDEARPKTLTAVQQSILDGTFDVRSAPVWQAANDNREEDRRAA